MDDDGDDKSLDVSSLVTESELGSELLVMESDPGSELRLGTRQRRTCRRWFSMLLRGIRRRQTGQAILTLREME